MREEEKWDGCWSYKNRMLTPRKKTSRETKEKMDVIVVMKEYMRSLGIEN